MAVRLSNLASRDPRRTFAPVWPALLALALACGRSPPSPVEEPTVTLAQAIAPAPSEEPHADVHTAEADIALAQANLPPGDLIVVFSNNMDGEIEPCG